MIKDENSIKKGLFYKPETEDAIKECYRHWMTPTQIAIALDLIPLEVHNFIQAKQKEWQELTMYCKRCEVDPEKHIRCSSCEIFVHLEEEVMRDLGRKDWYKMYHVIKGKVFCNWCIVNFMKQHYEG